MNGKDTPSWYVMRAYRQESKAEAKLSAAGIRSFVPRHYIMQHCHQKTIRRFVPVIANLVFVYATRACLLEFKQTFNALQFVMWRKNTGLEYLKVPTKEMEDFILVSKQREQNPVFHTLDEVNLKAGTRIRVHGGAFDGVEGNYVTVHGHRVRRLVVSLQDVLAVSVEIQPDLIEEVTALDK